MSSSSRLMWVFRAILVLAFTAWFSILPISATDLIKDYWHSALTMLFGSFIAGSTPLGGGAVAFPILTKILEVEPEQAKLFSLFIQSVGMTSAFLLFTCLNIRIYWRWLFWLLPSSTLGLFIGLFYINASGHHTKLLLSIFILVTGMLLLQKHFGRLNPFKHPAKKVPAWTLLVMGFPAGILSSLIGTGADTLLFFFLVIAFNQDIKKVIPTTVTYMAICSLIGTLAVGLNSELLVTPFVINSWYVSAPVVALGAPLGGWIMSKSNPSHLIIFIKLIILIEAISTLILVKLAFLEKTILILLIIAATTYFIYRMTQLKKMLRST